MPSGLIVRPIGEPSKRFYSGLGIPMVSLYKMTDRKNIVISSEEGGSQVARHFYSLGHRRMGYIGPVQSQTGNDKLAGFKGGLEEYGLCPEAVLECRQHETAENTEPESL